MGESVELQAAAEEACTGLASSGGWFTIGGGDAPLVKVWPKVCKERVTSFRAMVDSVGQEPSLSDVRLLAVCLVAFYSLKTLCHTLMYTNHPC